MKLSALVAVGTLALACSGLAAGGEEQVNEHNLTVSRNRPWAHAAFQVIQKERSAALNTTPEGNDQFIPGTGRVAETARHGEAIWIMAKNEAGLCRAQCARVPAKTPSRVICVGQFKIPAAGGGAAGGGAAQGGQAAPPTGPSWRSELNEPGTHVIIANAYNRPADTVLDADGLSYNLIVGFSALALRTMYPVGDGNRVVVVGCGAAMATLPKNIPQIGQFPAHLAGLQPPVQNGSVITLDTLGHGRDWPIMQSTILVMLCARQAPPNALDVVGRSADYAFEIKQPEAALDVNNYAQLVRPCLRDNAFVNLNHCHTGEGYTSPVQGVGKVRSVAGQLKTILPAGMTVSGIIGLCKFPAPTYTDTNHNGHWDFGEPIDGVVPHPDASGDNWEVNGG
jgi:hypothetical protein